MIYVLGLCLIGFGLGALLGAPYVPLLGREIEPILDAVGLARGQSLIDLGCGDGRLLKAAAKQGISGVGYEINPWLWLVAKINCYKYRRLVKIYLANFWRVNLPKTDAVFVFLIGRYMGRLDRYLTQQIKQPTKVVSYVFEIPGRKPAKKGRNYWIYDYR